MAATKKIDPLAALPDSARAPIEVLLDRLRELATPDLPSTRTNKLLEESERAFRVAEERCYREGRAKQTVFAGRTREYMSFIGENVKHHREDVGWTQTQLAAAMTRVGFDWKRITVAEVERGSRRVSLEEFLGLGSIFGEPAVSLMWVHSDGDDVAFAGSRGLAPGIVNLMLIGEGNEINAADLDWSAARVVAGLGDGADDWRAVPDRARRQRAGYGR
jgi:transcriptional regulator with XRE-family HTH domain